jgi:hypothetical protein
MLGEPAFRALKPDMVEKSPGAIPALSAWRSFSAGETRDCFIKTCCFLWDGLFQRLYHLLSCEFVDTLKITSAGGKLCQAECCAMECNRLLIQRDATNGTV